MHYVPDPYRALGLSRAASDAEIKAAHRRLAKRYHPDSPGGDTVRFLLVQDAYSLLSDPLRRREWDARHAPGPVRATDRASARPRGRDGRWTRAEQATGPSPETDAGTASGRDPGARSYTWSASEVPWWEEGGARESRRRQPGRKRPRDPADGRTARAPASEPGSGEQPPSEPGISGTQDFDVYNRSSGAAWSMAARAYFRRGDHDLPRRGSFRQQGSQPLTAARARVAAEDEARRARAAAPTWASGRPAARGAAGVVRDAESINEVRSSVREEALAARWPTLGQRLLYALLAWLPIAVLIGYGGAIATGCERAAVTCPPELATIQGVAIALALGLLVALPRLAYALALAAAGVALAGLALVIGIWVLGLRPPLPPSVLAISSVVLLVVHLLVASWALSGAIRRPWAGARERRLAQRRGR